MFLWIILWGMTITPTMESFIIMIKIKALRDINDSLNKIYDILIKTLKEPDKL